MVFYSIDSEKYFENDVSEYFFQTQHVYVRRSISNLVYSLFLIFELIPNFNIFNNYLFFQCY